MANYYGRLHYLAHNLEVLSGFSEAGREGVTVEQISQHSKTSKSVSDTFSTLVNTLVTKASFRDSDSCKKFKEGLITKMQTWKHPAVIETSLLGSEPSRDESLDNVVKVAESLSMHFTHKTKTMNFTTHKDARASQALVKECVLEVDQMAQKDTSLPSVKESKEKEKRAYYYGGGRTL